MARHTCANLLAAGDPMATMIEALDNLEAGVCRRVNRYSRRPHVKKLFTTVSRLGDGGFWVVMGLALLAIEGVPGLASLAHIGLTGGVCTLVYKGLKHRLVRERPYITYAEISCGTPPLDRYSFPSGHTLHAVAFTAMFGFYEPAMLVVTLPFAVLVAASRVVLGLHYPSDVLIGALIGAGIAACSVSLP